MFAAGKNQSLNLGTWNLSFSAVSIWGPIFLIFWSLKYDHSRKSAIFACTKPNCPKKDENIYENDRRKEKTVSKTLWKWRNCAPSEALWGGGLLHWNVVKVVDPAMITILHRYKWKINTVIISMQICIHKILSTTKVPLTNFDLQSEREQSPRNLKLSSLRNWSWFLFNLHILKQKKNLQFPRIKLFLIVFLYF